MNVGLCFFLDYSQTIYEYVGVDDFYHFNYNIRLAVRGHDII